MSVSAALGLLAGLVAATSLLAVVIRRTSGRGRVVSPDAPSPEIPLGDRRLGRVATFVQFGTETCAPCHVASRRIGTFAAEHDDVVHVELDTADHPDLARSLNILSAPTTFLLDRAGRIRVRFAGVPRPEELERHVASLPSLQEPPAVSGPVGTDRSPSGSAAPPAGTTALSPESAVAISEPTPEGAHDVH